MAPERLNIKALKEAFKLFLKFSSYSQRLWKAHLISFILGSVSIAFALLNPYLSKIILDNGILGKNIGLFLKFTMFSAIVYAFRLFVDKSAVLIKKYIARKVKINLSKDVFKKVRKFPLESFANMSVGECVSRVNSDITFASGIIAGAFGDIIQSAFKIILVTMVIFFINTKILILILVYQLIAMAQMNFFTKRNETLARSAYDSSRDMAKIITQIFSQIYFVKATGTMFLMMQRYFHSFAKNVRIEVAMSRLESASGSMSEASNKIFFGVVGFTGAILVINGQLTLGGLAAIMAYLSQGIGAYTELLNLCQKVVLSRIPLERTYELLNTEIHVCEKPGSRDVNFTMGKIEFQDVSFAYQDNHYILNKINFLIDPGAKVGLVGFSGCGKTTIVNLILRLYDVSAGKIILDDYDIRDMRLRSIYNQISLASQSPFIWSGSIRSNIQFGSLKIDESEMIDAAKIAQIHSTIDELSAGYDTLLADMICPLSQGQKQRIAIARAILKKPKILIFDEACSSLDSQTEEQIIDNIKVAFPRLTLILVSHRLCAVRKMEKIYFLDSLSRMRSGTHEQLSVASPQYSELFASQIQSAENNHDTIMDKRSARYLPVV